MLQLYNGIMTNKHHIKKSFTVTDIRKKDVFPDLTYRFSTLTETDSEVVLERDFLGENPLHYYSDITARELIVANNIIDIKNYLETKTEPRTFTWERVRAVSNNNRVTIDDARFVSTMPREEELGPILQELESQLDHSIPAEYADLIHVYVGKKVRGVLEKSIEERLSNLVNPESGLLLSGGLDSMSVGYLLSQAVDKTKVTAFTLKVDENDQDVVRSRELAQRFNIDLAEVKIDLKESGLLIRIQRYSPARELLYTRNIAEDIKLDDAILDALKISGNPKKDNLFCAVAMHLIAPAIKEEGIKTVFCGEGPNEMINDYGFNPRDSGYPTEYKGDIAFRQALTFGSKKTDRQLGRGGLPKHALARMGKIFAHHGLRLEAPYFNREIARVMTRVPHVTSYDTIKQHLVGAMFQGEGLEKFINGTSKEKFQDGSGLSRLLRGYDQQRLLDMFESIYGIQKTGYLK